MSYTFIKTIAKSSPLLFGWDFKPPRTCHNRFGAHPPALSASLACWNMGPMNGKKMEHLWQIFGNLYKNPKKINGCNHLQQESHHPHPLKLQVLKEKDDDYRMFREILCGFSLTFPVGQVWRFDGKAIQELIVIPKLPSAANQVGIGELHGISGFALMNWR